MNLTLNKSNFCFLLSNNIKAILNINLTLGLYLCRK